LSHIIGVDIGGTFTDCVLIDTEGNVTIAKALSIPPNELEQAGTSRYYDESAERWGAMRRSAAWVSAAAGRSRPNTRTATVSRRIQVRCYVRAVAAGSGQFPRGA
jgi:predicted NBD/HSP70 family sugar kinase